MSEKQNYFDFEPLGQDLDEWEVECDVEEFLVADNQQIEAVMVSVPALGQLALIEERWQKVVERRNSVEESVLQ